MDKEGFIVDGDYSGYIFVGWAAGLRDPMKNETPGKKPYYNMYVISPVSSYRSEEYEASGFKAEKLKCVSSEVWANLKPGDKIRVFFDSPNNPRVTMVALEA